MSRSSLDSELLNQLIVVIEQRILHQDEQIDIKLITDTLKDIFPHNHDDVEATVKSFFGKGISVTRKPDRIVYQASSEARKYLSECRKNWFIVPGSTNLFQGKLIFTGGKLSNKYRVFRKSNPRVDEMCQHQKGFLICRKRIFRSHEILLETEQPYHISKRQAPILFRVCHRDGMSIGNYLAQCMLQKWPSYEFEIRIAF